MTAKNLDYRLSAVRAALATGLVVRFTQAEFSEVVAHARATGMMPPVAGRYEGKEVIRAFGLDAIALKYVAGEAQWLLVPPGARDPHGELGGGAQVVAARWGKHGLALLMPEGVFEPGQVDLLEEAEDDARAGTFC
jgi:hypothetical protein